MANTQYQWEGNAPTSCRVAKSVVQVTILRNAIMKYLSVKSIVMIIAITFSGSQAWAKDWSKVKTCAEQEAVDGKKPPACTEPIDANATEKDVEYIMRFDFDDDGCLPSAGVSKLGAPNTGIPLAGASDESCTYRDQLTKANTMYRKRCVNSNSTDYCVRMFALYFVKDQKSGGGGHENDWEFGLIWTKQLKIKTIRTNNTCQL